MKERCPPSEAKMSEKEGSSRHEKRREETKEGDPVGISPKKAKHDA